MRDAVPGRRRPVSATGRLDWRGCYCAVTNATSLTVKFATQGAVTSSLGAVRFQPMAFSAVGSSVASGTPPVMSVKRTVLTPVVSVGENGPKQPPAFVQTPNGPLATELFWLGVSVS